MTRTPAPRASWHVATVIDTREETPSSRRITFDVPTWPGNDAGSHVDIRLTAPDGYQATRSYSLASSGEGTRVVLAVAEVPGGEVSPFLVQDLRVGDQAELHGPLGAFFVWRPSVEPGRPVQLIGGGSGVVPLIAMAQAHATAADATPFRLLYSVRTPDDVFFAGELRDLAAADAATPMEVDYVFTRRAPDHAQRPVGRVTPELLAELVWPPDVEPRIFVCGPTAYVEAVAHALVAAGHRPASIRTERFGGT
ncbi:FAD-binding oxidoreductase [Agromyces sp. LHK192]|uniref:FAD-binding oxidoreductase n=1 Tax=Agromyces sp. LHK192 TaxID=2498704 RepID=UPI00196A2558|nr:FAD-binding oxidoreductase [Agromyces sp. LHK192]